MYTTAFLALLLTFAAIPPSDAAQFNVTVGGTGVLKYDPETINASIGDTVLFNFHQKNHTVTQSSFANPCQPLEGGFDSGFVPVGDDVVDNFPVAQLTVTSEDPTWIFCRQSNHCQQGMVFAINPTADKTFDAFQQAAIASGNNTASASASSTSTATSSIITSAATSTPSVVTVTATVTVSSGGDITTTYGSYPGSAAPTSAVSSDHKVVVGGSGLFYSPSNITAQPGDTITFEFHQKNHTATQSSFANPCRSLTLTSTTGQIGFDSGFMPVSDNATTFPTFTIQVNDSSPIWVYCKQANHCGQGMVFSANAIETGPNNFAAFQAKAKALNGTTSSGSGSAASASATNSGARTVAKWHASGLALVAMVATTLL
ncbi:hypothetical protein PUNSTDRAFT_53336 [Punctularia strigosozonata HHB-11173 SS5]|uniref:uncharacterized protein n=1 Tax=Punctularia strigosozonata (strain HHB-11173) TaxID=741275 RepID=UPI0004417DB4|nr:uncharacterized protein PUNSTDRAFT_53336 [Punctularia strigosozonata HHB-11173 SS5]EIN08042.1 hypothetical protein PUNSTDRAFT_53336 [Punctularia strigosozonata HHB-11173 SS5]